MQNNKSRAIVLISLAFIVAFSLVLAPATPVRASEGGGWGDFIDADGNILPGVIEGGEVSMSADWMPNFPAWTGIEMDATYNVMTSENGSSVLIPSMTTLFFMALNPIESGLTDANGMLGSGAGGMLLSGGLLGAGNVSLSNLFQALTGMSQVQADQFADAAIAGNGNIWSILNPFSGQTDLSTILMELANRSLQDGNIYLMAMLYESCLTSPTGCPEELCLVNPAACGLPTPDPEAPTPEPTPTEPPTCPGPNVEQAWPTISIRPTAPNYPVVVGQDPDQRGVDIQASVSIPPVVYTWYEPIYEDVQECRASGGGTSNCTRANGQPGWLRTVPVLVGCEFRQELLPEQITQLTARSAITAASRDWIVNGLGAHWYGAQVKQGAFNLNNYAQVNMGCNGGTCTGSLTALGIPYADPGFHDLTITVGTAGTFHNGRMITTPRILTGSGQVGVWVILPALIDANP